MWSEANHFDMIAMTVGDYAGGHGFSLPTSVSRDFQSGADHDSRQREREDHKTKMLGARC